MNSAQLERLAQDQFGLTPCAPVKRMADGHINRSAMVVVDDGIVVLQEMNSGVFADPEVLMANTEAIISRMLEHNLPSLTFRRTTDGGFLAVQDGVPWRCYDYVEGEATPAIVTPEEAQSTARAFGRFAKAIDGLELVEHVSGYHDFDARVSAFETELTADAANRAAGCGDVSEQMLTLIDRLRLTVGYDSWRSVPVRNAHNDAKGPNCIVGPTGKRTIIDLDTAMPGTVLSDIGELVRSSTRSLVDASPEGYMAQIESVNRGFLAGYGGELASNERDAMLLAGPLMAVENAVRFLTDHLAGDVYYGADSPNQNLERSIAQLELGHKLVAAIEWATTG